MSCNEREIPWIPYVAIAFLERILRPEMHIFEYGTGGSTLFFARRVSHVVSVEHEKDFYQALSLPSNCECLFVPPEVGEIGKDSSSPRDYYSDQYPGFNFRAYASVIDSYDPFDLVFVDGRARPSCLRHGSKKVKKGGYLMLDNSNRAYYHEQFELDWEKQVFFGLGPHHSGRPWEATVWMHGNR